MKEKELLIKSWRGFIVKEGLNYLITITFNKSGFELSDRKALFVMQRLLYFSNTSLFRGRYERGIEYLTGFAVLEHHKSGLPHFHLVISNDVQLIKLRQGIKRHLKKFPELLNQSLDIREIKQGRSDQMKVAAYLQKEADEFFVLNVDGLN